MTADKQGSDSRQFTVPLDISDADVIEAMKEIGGYLDITPGDLKEVMRVAYRQAMKRIANSVLAVDIMTSPVYTVNLDSAADEVIDLMAERRISGVPVLDQAGKVAGVISERDFLSRMCAPDKTALMSVIAECMKGESCLVESLRWKTAGDIMTAPAITVDEKVTLFQIMELFSSKKINRVPVVGGNGDLKGIVSRGDIIRAPIAGLR